MGMEGGRLVRIRRAISHYLAAVSVLVHLRRSTLSPKQESYPWFTGTQLGMRLLYILINCPIGGYYLSTLEPSFERLPPDPNLSARRRRSDYTLGSGFRPSFWGRRCRKIPKIVINWTLSGENWPIRADDRLFPPPKVFIAVIELPAKRELIAPSVSRSETRRDSTGEVYAGIVGVECFTRRIEPSVT